ncbi:protein kinase family protein [Nigerium massiliense]|uniref:hypothetical protein n=1 Tax=Nigerium massiliense TaxID=1522317 RepID=UPI00069406B8|nr:hypothetical protein [Nigerium massiliense]
MANRADQERALDWFTGPQRAGIVRAALAALGRPDPEHLLVGVDRVHHRPEVDTTVLYSLNLTSADPAVAKPELVLIVTTAALPEGVASFEYDGLTLRTWKHPDDPRLPALQAVDDPERLRAWLPSERRDGGARGQLLSYRPLRRAVVRLDGGGKRYYVKLIRADRAAGLSRRYRLLDAAGLGPVVAGEPEDGVLVAEKVPGRSLAHALVAWHDNPSALPAPQEVADLLDRMPDGLLALPRRESWAERADFHGATAAAALPQHAGEIRSITQHLQRLVADAPTGPVVPTHGDFYEANVFVAKGHFTRMIDVDAAGPGLREDDLACLLGHLAVLPDLSPSHYPRIVEVTQSWGAAFEQMVAPAALRARTAGVILSLVAGTTPAHALARLDLCRAWLYRAESC